MSEPVPIVYLPLVMVTMMVSVPSTVESSTGVMVRSAVVFPLVIVIQVLVDGVKSMKGVAVLLMENAILTLRSPEELSRI